MTKVKIIGIAGKARSGKDTVAERLVQGHGFVRMAFADPLKEAARCIFGLSDAQLYGDLKETNDAFWGKTPRRIMQLLGTDAVRKNIDDDVWIKATQRRIETEMAERDTIGIVIPDVRFPNEADAIRAWGGDVWHVSRPGIAAVEEHVSETALKNYGWFSQWITNDETVLDLHSKVDVIINKKIDPAILLKRAYEALSGDGPEADGRVGALLADLKNALERVSQ